jgi:hypothetical protein
MSPSAWGFKERLIKKPELNEGDKDSASLGYSSILKMEVKCSAETSVDFQRTTRLNIPEDVNP